MSALVASTTPSTSPSPAPTRTRLLGRFLVDEGLITEPDLDEALRLMSAVNVSLGDLASERGWITAQEAAALQRMQLRVDGRFGELAMRHGIGQLTPQRLETLRWEQDAHNLRLGDALVQLGAITATEMDRQAGRFEALHAPVEFDLILPEPLAQHPLAYRAVQVLPRLLRRLLAGPARLGRPAAWAPRPSFATAMARLPGPAPLMIGFVAPAGVALDIADAFGAVLRRRATQGSPDVKASVTRVVELWARQVLDADGEVEGAVVVEPGEVPASGLEFEVALAEGVASLVIECVAS